MRKFKNIIFDFGGVILTEDDNWLFSKETKTFLDTNSERLSEGWNSAWPNARAGKINEEQFFNIFLKNSIGTTDDKKITKLKKIYRKMSSKLESFSLLDKLKINYRLFSLANITSDWLKYKIDKFALNKYFDLIVSSCGEGIEKPHKEIFFSLIKKAKIKTEESLFIDNFARNIKPARELGFETILFTNKVDLVKKMKKLGIKI